MKNNVMIIFSPYCSALVNVMFFNVLMTEVGYLTMTGNNSIFTLLIRGGRLYYRATTSPRENSHLWKN